MPGVGIDAANSGNASGIASVGAGDSEAQGGKVYDDGGIIISSIGLNLGEILLPFTQGAPTNGGSGLELESRWTTSNLKAQQSYTQAASISTPIGNITGLSPVVLLAGGGALILVLIFIARKRR